MPCAVFGKRYRFVKLAAVARCDIPAVFLQVWASNFLPNEPALAERCQREYKQKHGEPMLLQYARMEAQAQVTVQTDMEINAVIRSHICSESPDSRQILEGYVEDVMCRIAKIWREMMTCWIIVSVACCYNEICRTRLNVCNRYRSAKKKKNQVNVSGSVYYTGIQ